MGFLDLLNADEAQRNESFTQLMDQKAAEVIVAEKAAIADTILTSEQIDESTGHKLVHSSGKELKKGDKVKDFRGDTHTIEGFTPPHTEASTGRVHTNHGSFFPSVVDAKIVKEEVEQIDEISKKTLGSYVNKAAKDASHASMRAGTFLQRADNADAYVSDDQRGKKRLAGIGKAVKRLGHNGYGNAYSTKRPGGSKVTISGGLPSGIKD